MKGTIQVLEKKERHCMLRCKKSETENDAYDHPQENETTTFSFHLSLHFSSSSLSLFPWEWISLTFHQVFLPQWDLFENLTFSLCFFKWISLNINPSSTAHLVTRRKERLVNVIHPFDWRVWNAMREWSKERERESRNENQCWICMNTKCGLRKKSYISVSLTYSRVKINGTGEEETKNEWWKGEKSTKEGSGRKMRPTRRTDDWSEKGTQRKWERKNLREGRRMKKFKTLLTYYIHELFLMVSQVFFVSDFTSKNTTCFTCNILQCNMSIIRIMLL